ncbi:alkaline phosphatase family protein [Natronococcus jeotgali]|uniref:Type I phosphodiesterase/nucleotide pyrophosphatase n=1 Tax=Natronococcus jeotgali DSM 18795 TaxID=1227498 RepID=L9WSG8_9EURY|nr:alkaline phosphatase family protein [Natronococcus jeotgali]ELY52151.1 type I phosphodiesterase/nucleotide pyrophosphatase [Natronococcus jeotgali DSM 18795]
MRASLESRLRERSGEDGIVFPAYDDYSFANVPETALAVLDDAFERRLPADVLEGVATDVDNVVVFLLDGFGYEHWKRHRGAHEFLRRIEDAGTVAPLTAVYPSETAAALTTVATAAPPVEHGLLGWFQYLESAGRIVETLPFRTLEGDPLADVSPTSSATELFTGRSIYERAEQAGIDPYAILPAEFVESGYTRATAAGATRVGYDTATDLALSIRRALEVSADPAYVYAYEPTIDAISHAEGTGTERYRQNLAAVLERLQHELLERLDPDLAARTLLVVTADHGIVDTAPEENVTMTDWERWPSLRETFRRDEAGEPRLPTGSPRNVHFHVRPDRLEEARGIVEAALDGRTFTREEALEGDLFGPGEPSALFERRCGDLIAVHRNRGLWWAEMDSIGMHGGLTDEEMLVPLAAARLDALRASR